MKIGPLNLPQDPATPYDRRLQQVLYSWLGDAQTLLNGILNPVNYSYIVSTTADPAGAPANTPSGTVPAVYNLTNNKLWVYNTSSAAWKSVTLA